MGRRKISIQPIKEERNRQVTFTKRKNGLYKKAMELSILCQSNIALIMIAKNGKVFQYSSSEDMQHILKQHESCKHLVHEHKTNLDFEQHCEDDDTDNDIGGLNSNKKFRKSSFEPQTQDNISPSSIASERVNLQEPLQYYQQVQQDNMQSIAKSSPNQETYLMQQSQQRNVGTLTQDDQMQQQLKQKVVGEQFSGSQRQLLRDQLNNSASPIQSMKFSQKPTQTQQILNLLQNYSPMYTGNFSKLNCAPTEVQQEQRTLDYSQKANGHRAFQDTSLQLNNSFQNNGHLNLSKMEHSYYQNQDFKTNLDQQIQSIVRDPNFEPLTRQSNIDVRSYSNHDPYNNNNNTIMVQGKGLDRAALEAMRQQQNASIGEYQMDEYQQNNFSYNQVNFKDINPLNQNL